MAARTHYSKALLGMLETGQRTVRSEHVSAYSQALDVSVPILTEPVGDPVRIAHGWLVADTPSVAHSAAGRMIGAGLAVQLEERVIELRRLDDAISGRELFPVVSKELADAQMVVRECSYTDEVGRRLLSTVGELAQLAGWVTSDAGHYAEAQRIYLEGHHAAATADNQPLAGQLLSSLAYQLANIGRPADAVLLARSAVVGSKNASPAAKALLLERVAWASAKAGDEDTTRRALDAVDDAFESCSRGGSEPDWVYWLNRNEIEVMAGRCFVELGDPTRAEELLSPAIDRYPSHLVREVALYRTWLAEAHARTGDLDAARHILARLSSDIGSARLARRVGEVRQLVAASAGKRS